MENKSSEDSQNLVHGSVDDTDPLWSRDLKDSEIKGSSSSKRCQRYKIVTQ
jgi:hypothetical protein